MWGGEKATANIYIFGLIFFSVLHPSRCLKVKWWVIIIIIRLRSRRLQQFSKNSFLKLARQLHLDTDRFLYPNQLLDVRYVACLLSPWSPSAMSWNIKSNIICMVHHLASYGCVQETQLVLSYSVDKGLGVCHLMNSYIAYTVKTLDV